MAGTVRGVYFMSDDWLFDLTVAFLNSFRAHNPDMPLVLVPCYDRIDRLRALQDEYAFSVFDDPVRLARCDRISLRFHDHVLGHYRKLAMWEGVLDEFLYVDVDTVVLGHVGFVFKYLADHDFVASHSDIPRLRNYVWKRSIDGAGLLDRDQIAYSASTGFIASKKHALSLARAEDVASQADRLTPHMVLHCIEQPFLNYLIVTSGRPYTSLYVHEKQGHDPEMMAERWAGEWGGVVRGGTIRFRGKRPPTLLVHWAGKWQATCFGRKLRSLARFFGRNDDDKFPRRRFMPYKRLWNHYRHLRDREQP